MHLSVRRILLGQLVLYGGLTTCILILPSGLSSNDGISYYGTHAQTVIPYAFGLIGAAIFGWLAANALTEPSLRIVRLSLDIYGFLMLGVIMTPYGTGRWMNDAHTLISVTLFSLQTLLGVWFASKLATWWSWLLILIAVGAGFISILFISPTHGFLLQAQLVFQVAFGVLVVLGLQSLLRGNQFEAKPNSIRATSES